MANVTFDLDEPEYKALKDFANDEEREPNRQAKIFVLKALEFYDDSAPLQSPAKSRSKPRRKRPAHAETAAEKNGSEALGVN